MAGEGRTALTYTLYSRCLVPAERRAAALQWPPPAAQIQRAPHLEHPSTPHSADSQYVSDEVLSQRGIFAIKAWWRFAIQNRDVCHLCLGVRRCLEVFEGGLEIVILQGNLGRLKVLQGAHDL